MWMTLLTVGLDIVGWMIRRSKVSKEQKEKFLAFYKAYSEEVNASVEQRKDAEAQLKDLEQKEKK